MDIDDALRRAQGGDPDAYGIVVRATQARLRSFIAGYVPRAEWVDDIAQQTFVSAYRDLRKFQVGTDFAAWIRRIAYNHLRAELERAGRRRRLEGELLARLERAPETPNLDPLKECVESLPPTSQEIVRSYYADSLGLAEIGKRLGRSADSLKVALFKIRARLRECVESKLA
ncbi:MAG TPA: sigma-70 family RNA polymerase sigma factor [Planctomycetota bacterium]